MNDSMDKILAHLENARDTVIYQLDKRLDKIETKIDHLQSFKWKIVGGSGIVSFIIAIAIEMFKK